MRHTIHTLGLLTFLSIGCADAQQPAGTEQVPSEVTRTEPVSMDVDAKTFNAMIGKNGALLLDVRTPAEFNSGHIAGATNMDWSAHDYETRFATLDPATPVMVYCAAGGRSEQAKQYLVDRGFQVTQLLEGMGGWREAGLPVTQE
ncbi:MAG: rhodanese-like domain-containing protein [Flavobacteriales bacterium]|nr:rhodanese-like domain-containing protein [Flavobacteriales bacterium]